MNKKMFIIEVPMYTGKGKNKVFSCNWYVTGFKWHCSSDERPNKIEYGADRKKALEMGRITAEDRLAQFHLVGKVVPASEN